ncbi:hypothetical protein BGZ60DRAFT_521145 [Tricladium varicosporioides]|nr:hypothetical protein BGZ60DRAFT_521145 [Hymenoscyphus varicosporioides]
MIAVRDVSKGETAKSNILKSNPDCSVDVWSLDYDSYDSIIAFGEKVATVDRLDYVLLNAGVKMMAYSKAHTGHETNVQINHLAKSLLSLLLPPILKKSSKTTGNLSRLTIVSSEGHFWVGFEERLGSNILARMDEEETFGKAMTRYYTSKLLNVLWTRELTTRVREDEIVINTVNPGFCYSGLHRHESTGIIKGGHNLADALVLYESSHGQYLSEQHVLPFYGIANMKEAWDFSVPEDY